MSPSSEVNGSILSKINALVLAMNYKIFSLRCFLHCFSVGESLSDLCTTDHHPLKNGSTPPQTEKLEWETSHPFPDRNSRHPPGLRPDDTNRTETTTDSLLHFSSVTRKFSGNKRSSHTAPHKIQQRQTTAVLTTPLFGFSDIEVALPF